MEHRKYLSYNANEFTRWAQTVGQYTQHVVEHFLSSGRAPEQGNKSCASLTNLVERYGLERLEHACDRVLMYSSEPSVWNISTILKNGQDKVRGLQFQPHLQRQRGTGSPVALHTSREVVSMHDQPEHDLFPEGYETHRNGRRAGTPAGGFLNLWNTRLQGPAGSPCGCRIEPTPGEQACQMHQECPFFCSERYHRRY